MSTRDISSHTSWRCEACLGPIFGRDGYLGVTYTDILGNGPVHWTPLHDRCRTSEGLFAYDIGIDELATREQIARWTGHLAGKVWHDRSDWTAVTAQAATWIPGRPILDSDEAWALAELTPEPTADPDPWAETLT